MEVLLYLRFRARYELEGITTLVVSWDWAGRGKLPTRAEQGFLFSGVTSSPRRHEGCCEVNRPFRSELRIAARAFSSWMVPVATHSGTARTHWILRRRIVIGSYPHSLDRFGSRSPRQKVTPPNFTLLQESAWGTPRGEHVLSKRKAHYTTCWLFQDTSRKSPSHQALAPANMTLISGPITGYLHLTIIHCLPFLGSKPH